MKSILVTGASTGIGRALAEAIAAGGLRVYATVRKDEDLRTLNALDGVTALRLDVRSAEEVAAVVACIREDGDGLHALINNAAVNGLGPFSTYDDTALREIFEVNIFGLHRVTNACLPLLVESRGRVVNIGSQGGVMTARYFGPYTMTKHALEAYSASLAEELEPHGVYVSIVQPGGIESAMADNSLASSAARFRSAEPPFDTDAREFLAMLEADEEPDGDAPESAENRKPSSPDIVVRAVWHALTAERPQRRYLVGTRWEGDRVIHGFLDKLVEANRSPSMGYSRDELVALLDQHLKE